MAKKLLFSHWLVKSDYKAKAQIKYEIKQIESRLERCLSVSGHQAYLNNECLAFCNTLAAKYLEYVNLTNNKDEVVFPTCSKIHEATHWSSLYRLIASLKEQLRVTNSHLDEQRICQEIADLYWYLTHSKLKTNSIVNSSNIGVNSKKNYSLFAKIPNKNWILSIVDYWNQQQFQEDKLDSLFIDRDEETIRYALAYFTNQECIDAVNALFFYKLYPDKLYQELMHPEKLVSVRIRLGVLHDFIETIQKKLYNICSEMGVAPGVDRLFHGDELPQGIMIQVEDKFCSLIQTAVKNLKVQITAEKEEQTILERLYDLGRAYKFWFNPNRLIDAVMVLHQRLVHVKIGDMRNETMFQLAMTNQFKQLNTTECMYLYGYFANNDTRYLLYVLHSVGNGQIYDWIPHINEQGRQAVYGVFKTLFSVMEALRVELKDRNIITEPYKYDAGGDIIQVKSRNREAILRIIAIYGAQPYVEHNSVDALFSSVEDSSS